MRLRYFYDSGPKKRVRKAKVTVSPTVALSKAKKTLKRYYKTDGVCSRLEADYQHNIDLLKKLGEHQNLRHILTQEANWTQKQTDKYMKRFAKKMNVKSGKKQTGAIRRRPNLGDMKKVKRALKDDAYYNRWVPTIKKKLAKIHNRYLKSRSKCNKLANKIGLQEKAIKKMNISMGGAISRLSRRRRMMGRVRRPSSKKVRRSTRKTRSGAIRRPRRRHSRKAIGLISAMAVRRRRSTRKRSGAVRRPSAKKVRRSTRKTRSGTVRRHSSAHRRRARRHARKALGFITVSAVHKRRSLRRKTRRSGTVRRRPSARRPTSIFLKKVTHRKSSKRASGSIRRRYILV